MRGLLVVGAGLALAVSLCSCMSDEQVAKVDAAIDAAKPGLTEAAKAAAPGLAEAAQDYINGDTSGALEAAKGAGNAAEKPAKQAGQAALDKLQE